MVRQAKGSSIKAGDLVQIRKGVQGAGEIGIVIAPSTDRHPLQSPSCFDVLFSDGVRVVHPSNVHPPGEKPRVR